ncbi:hypothetical protein H3N56_02995 [Cetobacterium sp. 2A]|uniref:hypothetical protein n=1 Tax=Cetobacterium sp. 2A TaxID=2754723 RepID=UPI00163BAA59|nr:hypothetical protein [Cetobacterium sp. 2A]MBC2855461.1 hypothetical protein [Cetobacterium sp. 2A]
MSEKRLKIISITLIPIILLLAILGIIFKKKEFTEKNNQNEIQDSITGNKINKNKEITDYYKNLGYYDIHIIDDKVFVQTGYYKNDNIRSFTVFTEETDPEKLIEYSVKKDYTPGGETIIHFFNDFINTPDNNLYKGFSSAVWLRGSFFDKNKPYMIGTYQKLINGDITWYDKSDATCKI